MLGYILLEARIRTPWTALLLAPALCLPLLLAAAPPADAAKPRIRAAATLTACQGERVGLAYSLRGDGKVHGATLRVSAVIYPLFGAPRPAGKLEAGRKRGIVRSEGFDALPADTYVGIVRYRWTTGRRTVAFGSVRTTKARVGRRRGRAFCTLPIGRRPVDSTAPFVALLPDTAEWLRAPVDITFLAFDDLSGVQGVFSSIDGGPAVLGRTRSIASEGVHTVEYAARDVAGNTSPVKRGVVRVDGGPPTAPALTRPAAVTGSVRPTVSWGASTDSGSGVRAYVVAIRDPSGGLVSTKRVGADTLSTTIDDTLAPGAYTAEVYAVDGTTPEPFVAGSGQRAFEVRPGPPQVTGTTPGGGETIPKANAAADLTVAFDRPMDAASVQGAVTLARIAPSPLDPVPAAVSCPGDCTQATLDPSSTLGEGVYELRVGTGAASEEGVPLAASHTSRFSVPVYEESFDGAGCGAPAWTLEDPWQCRSAGVLPGRYLSALGEEQNRVTVDRDRDAVSSAFSMDPGSVPSVEVRFTRRFDRPADACPADSAQADVLLNGLEDVARRATYTSAAPVATQTIAFSLPGTRNVSVRLRLHVDGCRTGNASGLNFHGDDIRIARVP